MTQSFLQCTDAYGFFLPLMRMYDSRRYCSLAHSVFLFELCPKAGMIYNPNKNSPNAQQLERRMESASPRNNSFLLPGPRVKTLKIYAPRSLMTTILYLQQFSWFYQILIFGDNNLFLKRNIH